MIVVANKMVVDIDVGKTSCVVLLKGESKHRTVAFNEIRWVSNDWIL